jgi:lysozyme
MKTSQEGLDFLAKEEGVVLHEYRDQVGLLTIGVGHLLRPGERYPQGISREKAFDLLRQDVEGAEAAVNTTTATLRQNQFDALVSLVFNIGVAAFKGSTLLRKLNEGDMAAVEQQFHVWRKGGGQVLPVLVARRRREAGLFSRP